MNDEDRDTHGLRKTREASGRVPITQYFPMEVR
ncbi:hypothetical protein PHO31112_03164 [Pandoraea horticolens]|uniref:Uncharacterized protein n=1 Tax=Pandoraea horticolens TaxID=2508298 RepID=A0A5E4WF82_9BURK|nr:hypothetical protein PHO31112_03164 [Pandoraea horticolens]